MPRARPGADANAPAGATPPSEAELREIALAHLARFAASENDLLRVLQRRVARWARRAMEAGADPDSVREQRHRGSERARGTVAGLAAAGILDDTAFARSRARALTRAGRSVRTVASHLAARGVDADTIEVALQTAQPQGVAATQLAAALVHARKRRIGPFAALSTIPEQPSDTVSARRRGLAMLARAGFSHDVASAALEVDRDAAEILIARLRVP